MKRARLELDLLAPPRRPRWPGYALLAAGALATAATLDRHHAAALELERLAAAAALLPAAPARVAPRPPLDERSAQDALRQLALPWAQLIETVEHAAHPDVAVLQLQPEPRQGVLRITAEARHRQAMFAYLRALAKQEGLSNVHVVGDEVRKDHPQQPVRFSAQASFRGLPQ
jgi:Tfp pilus assembly protein PilN